MSMRHKLRFLPVSVMAFALVIAVSSLSVGGASSIAQSFKSDGEDIVTGAIVSIKRDSPGTVELTTADSADRVLGVAGEDALIELTGEEGAVKVVTSGEAMAFVSDINGEVNVGDKIAASPIAGVGMKAVNSGFVIGSAQANLSNVDTEVRVIRDKNGDGQEVRVGAIPVMVDKMFYEAPKEASSYIPPIIQDIADSLAGRQVSPIRVIASGVLVLFALFAVTTIIYSSIKSSIISIGRNPLSRIAVQRSLLQMGLAVLGIMAFAALLVYLVLAL